MERNFETVMIEQCSPVLAGLKAAGLFRYETQDCKDLAERVRGWNARLGEKGLRASLVSITKPIIIRKNILLIKSFDAFL